MRGSRKGRLSGWHGGSQWAGGCILQGDGELARWALPGSRAQPACCPSGTITTENEDPAPDMLLFSHSVLSNSLQPHGLSPPGSSVRGIPQARILEWVAMPSSRGSSRPGDGTQVSRTSRWVLHCYATQEVQHLSRAGPAAQPHVREGSPLGQGD